METEEREQRRERVEEMQTRKTTTMMEIPSGEKCRAVSHCVTDKFPLIRQTDRGGGVRGESQAGRRSRARTPRIDTRVSVRSRRMGGEDGLFNVFNVQFVNFNRRPIETPRRATTRRHTGREMVDNVAS